MAGGKKKQKPSGKKSSGVMFGGNPGSFGGQAGGISFSGRVGGGVGNPKGKPIGVGATPRPGGSKNAQLNTATGPGKNTKPESTMVPDPRRNPRRGIM